MHRRTTRVRRFAEGPVCNVLGIEFDKKCAHIVLGVSHASRREVLVL
jgi:hypothetical protein